MCSQCQKSWDPYTPAIHHLQVKRTSYLPTPKHKRTLVRTARTHTWTHTHSHSRELLLQGWTGHRDYQDFSQWADERPFFIYLFIYFSAAPCLGNYDNSPEPGRETCIGSAQYCGNSGQLFFFFFLHGPLTASGPRCSCTGCTANTYHWPTNIHQIKIQ